MTTATEPPLIDEPRISVDEMPALDQPDVRVCQIRKGMSYETRRRCDLPAAWACTGRCSHCGVIERVLICELDRWRISRGVQVGCGGCGAVTQITHLEPIR